MVHVHKQEWQNPAQRDMQRSESKIPKPRISYIKPRESILEKQQTT